MAEGGGTRRRREAAPGTRRRREAGPRTFLFVLLCAAGVASLPPEASAQYRTTFFGGANVSGITPATLQPTLGSQSITLQAQSNQWWLFTRIYACTKTETPRNNAIAYVQTGCTAIGGATNTRGSQTVSVTVTQAMLDNGGVVIAVAPTVAPSFLGHGQWMPINAPGIELSRGTTTGVEAIGVTEEASTSYGVQLRVLPTADVVVDLSSSDGTAASVAPTSLTFSTTSWATAQTVTVSAPHDADRDSETVTVTHAVDDPNSASAYRTVGDKELTVRVTDNDAGLTVSSQTVTAQEGGSGGSYTVALDTQPGGRVTLTLETSPTGAVTVAPATLTFRATTWNTAQTVTATAADDTDGVNETVTVRHAAASADGRYAFAARTREDVTVTVQDDETPGVTLSPPTLNVTELKTPADGTEEATYTVVLDAGLKTGDALDIEVRSADAAAVRVASARSGGTAGATADVRFLPGNWDMAQTVTVYAQADANGAGEMVTLSHRIAAAVPNSGYPTTLTIGAVTVNVTDTETPAVTVSATTLRVEETEAETYTLALATEPTTPARSRWTRTVRRRRGR